MSEELDLGIGTIPRTRIGIFLILACELDLDL